MMESSGIFWRSLEIISLIAFLFCAQSWRTQSLASKKIDTIFLGMLPSFVVIWASVWMQTKVSALNFSDPYLRLALLFGAACVFFALSISFMKSFNLAAFCFRTSLLSMISLHLLQTNDFTLIACAIGFCAMISFFSAQSLHPMNNEQKIIYQEKFFERFRNLAWVEGSSLILMLVISLPLRKIFHISIDFNTGLIGLVHGVLVVIYFICLMHCARVFKWSAGKIIFGFFAALIPFLFLAFERFILKNRPKNFLNLKQNMA